MIVSTTLSPSLLGCVFGTIPPRCDIHRAPFSTRNVLCEVAFLNEMHRPDLFHQIVFFHQPFGSIDCSTITLATVFKLTRNGLLLACQVVRFY